MATPETTPNLPASASAVAPTILEKPRDDEIAMLEERIRKLECRLHGFEARLEVLSKDPNRKHANWVEEISGSMADNPAFEEMVRLGREFRESDRPKD